MRQERSVKNKKRNVFLETKSFELKNYNLHI